MIGRTHGVHAEPMTFGVKLALWYAETRARPRSGSCARARPSSVGKLSGAVGMFAHLDPSIEAAVCRRLGLTPAPGVVAGHPARSARGADDGARDSRGVAREVRARDSRPAEDGDRRSRRAVRPRPEGLVGDAAQAQSDRVRADRPGWRGSFAPTRWPRSRTSRSGTSATSRTRRSSASSCPTASSRSITCCAGSRGSSPAWSSIRTGCWRISRDRAASCSPASVLLELARRGVSREQAYEWVQRNAMRSFHEQRDFKALLAGRSPTSRRVLPRDGDRRGVRSRRAAAATSTRFSRACLACARADGGRWRSRAWPAITEDRSLMKARVFVTLKPSVFDPQGSTIAEALHSLGYGSGRRRPAGQVLRARPERADARRGREARRGSRGPRARQSGHRELPHRAARPERPESR